MSDEGSVFAPGEAVDEGAASDARATVFVSDPSAEAERVAQQLRGAGYRVVDVPLSLLAARVAVQTPSVIVVDADAVGAAEAVAGARSVMGGARLDILFLGVERPQEEAFSLDPSGAASGFFARPVDPQALVRKVDALTGGPSKSPPSAPPPSGPPRSNGPSTSAQPWPVGPSERRSPIPTAGPLSVVPVSGRSPPSSGGVREAPLSARSVRPSVSIQTSLSPELEALLAEAEQRVGAQMARELAPPTPEEEIESVLPEALLAALDEPLEEDEDDGLAEPPRSRVELPPDEPDGGRAGATTNAGRSLTPASSHAMAAEFLGVAPTLAAPPMAGPGPAVVVVDQPVPTLEPEFVGRPTDVPAILLLGPEHAPKMLASGIAARASGCYTFESGGALRRVVLRDGDVVTAASSADDETLLVFLTSRGDVPRDQVKDLTGKLPPFGRHAGAALVGHGLLRQDQLWPTLRAHAEWLLGRTFLIDRGTARVEQDPPGRLRQEPSVFGGSSGAEVLVEAARRVVTPEEALRRLGGGGACIAEGPSALLSECALGVDERAVIQTARGASLEELARREAGAGIASVVYGLSLLGVVVVGTPALPEPAEPSVASAALPSSAVSAVDALDLSAVRERVRARLELVQEADYFTLLGVSREATGYEVRRAYLELRRAFEPARVLTPELVDLEESLRTIVLVLDEAYEILRDGARRERYRRAIGD